jgi:quinohemoprotein amine dehydrogenase
LPKQQLQESVIFQLRETLLPAAVAVYDHIDFIKVTPDTSLSRLGGGTHPKGYAQFEAIAYLNGPDGKSNTPDDISLGPSPPNGTW